MEACAPPDVPAVLTCGADEENLHNNRLMARRLGAPLHEMPGGHNSRTGATRWIRTARGCSHRC